ncbi:MAG: hypothetical protein LBC07_04285 [Elusimicrobiota bacterium]|jgi:hypothetical protein|nr:hypothetical protein [Elusimicrobiota bacterium]
MNFDNKTIAAQSAKIIPQEAESPESKIKRLAQIMASIKNLFLLKGEDKKNDIVNAIANQLFNDGFEPKVIDLAYVKVSRLDGRVLDYPHMLEAALSVNNQVKEEFYRQANKKIQDEIEKYVLQNPDEINRVAQELPKQELLNKFLEIREEKMRVNRKYAGDPVYIRLRQSYAKGLGFALDALIKEIQEFRQQENL